MSLWNCCNLTIAAADSLGKAATNTAFAHSGMAAPWLRSQKFSLYTMYWRKVLFRKSKRAELFSSGESWCRGQVMRNLDSRPHGTSRTVFSLFFMVMHARKQFWDLHCPVKLCCVHNIHHGGYRLVSMQFKNASYWTRASFLSLAPPLPSAFSLLGTRDHYCADVHLGDALEIVFGLISKSCFDKRQSALRPWSADATSTG
jgi:hypothetical protein